MSYHVGIILVADSLTEVAGDFERWLPPGHEVLAEKRDTVNRLTEYLVEGPLLPEHAEIHLATPVVITVHEEFNQKTGVKSCMAYFCHSPKNVWDIHP